MVEHFGVASSDEGIGDAEKDTSNKSDQRKGEGKWDHPGFDDSYVGRREGGRGK